MAIKGMTDRPEMFPEIGQIRKGSPKDEKGQMGRDLTYFRIEVDEKEVDAQKAITSLYGDKPTELPIMLAFNEIDKVWDAWYEAYTAGRLVARADGEVFTYKIDTKTGEVLTGKEPIPFNKDEPVGYWYNKNKDRQEPIKCKPVGRLRVVLPGLGRLAYLTVMTTSYHDIINLSSQIQALAMFNNGRIAGIPLILKRRPKEISCPKPDGSRARYTKWMLSIEADPQWVALSLEAAKTLALPAGVPGAAAALLPSGEKSTPQGDDQFDPDENEDDSDIPGPNYNDYQEGEFTEEPQQPSLIDPDDPYAGVCNSEGMPYSDISVEKLQVMRSGLEKKANRTPEENRKLDAAKYYLAKKSKK